jgi:hypothetical protein
MTDLPAHPPRPVSPVAIIAALVGFSLFLIFVRLAYVRYLPPATQNIPAEKIAAGMEWQDTPAARKAYLDELRAKQVQQLSAYAWIDQSKGVVQLPIDRAMELVVRDTNAKAHAKPAPSSP